MSKWSQEELDAGREWRRQKAREARQHPEARRRALRNLAKDILIPLGVAVAGILIIWVANGFSTGERPLAPLPASSHDDGQQDAG